MKRSIRTLFVSIAMAGITTTGVAYAEPPAGEHSCQHGAGAMTFPGHFGYSDPERMIDRMTASLELSKGQRDAMRAIVDKARPQTRELRDRLADNRKQLHALMEQGAPKESEVRKLADAQGRAIADMIVLHTKVRTEMRAVLTDAQREQLKQSHEGRGWRTSWKTGSSAHELSGAASAESPGTAATNFVM